MVEPKQISYSQFSKWAECGWSWELKYIHKHKMDDTTIHTIFGTAIHETIQEWLDTLYNKSETIAKTVYLHDTFKEKLLKLFSDSVTVNEQQEKVYLCDKDTLKEFHAQGCEILDYIQSNHKKFFPTKRTKLFGIEFPIKMEVAKNVEYIGYLDVVTYDEVTRKYKIYDLKTSKAGWGDNEKNNQVKVGQLLLYKRFLAKQLDIPEEDVSVEYVILKRIVFKNDLYHIPRIVVYKPAQAKRTVDKIWKLFEEFISSCFDENGEYKTGQVAKPSKSTCRFCKFRERTDLCSVGIS